MILSINVFLNKIYHALLYLIMSSLTAYFETTTFSSSAFWAMLAAFLLVLPAILIGIATTWKFLQQKISDDISARVTKITNDLSAHDTKTFNAELYTINNKLYCSNQKN